MRAMIWLAVVVVAIEGRAEPPRVIYQCADPGGAVLFTDLPCAGGSAVRQSTTVTIHMDTPAAGEQAARDRPSRDRAEAGGAGGRPGSDPLATALARSQRSCAAALAGLDRLRATKRRGYRVSRAASLDARERDLQAQIDRDCTGYSR